MELIEKNEIYLVGLDFYGDPFKNHEGWKSENEIGKLWQRFMNLHQDYKSFFDKNQINKDILYEIHIISSKKQSEFTVFIGAEVENLDKIPIDFLGKIIPKSKYVNFELKVVESDKENDYMEKIRQKGLKENKKFLVQMYDNKKYFGFNNEVSKIDFLVPIISEEEK